MAYDENSIEMNRFVTSCIETIAQLTERKPVYDSKMSAKIKELSTKAYSKICDLIKPDVNSFVALTHGDLWSNNTMYTYDEIDNTTMPSDSILVDFQEGSIGSIAIDLTYTLFTSSHENIDDRHWDYLLQHYHNELKATLSKLNYSKQIPTLTDIHTQFLSKAITMIPMSLMVLGIRHFEYDEENTMSHFLGDTEEDAKLRYNMLANPKIEKSTIFLLNYFDRKGLLEV